MAQMCTRATSGEGGSCLYRVVMPYIVMVYLGMAYVAVVYIVLA